jgi:hypothetical protein
MRATAPELIDALDQVHIADCEEEREAVFRFRYSVYVEELGRKLGNADHVRRRVHDDEDDRPYTTLLYTADDEGSLTGTIRVRHWRPGEVPEKDDSTFSMERFEGLSELGTAEVGRLMIKPDRRGQLGLVAIACALYQLAATELAVDVASSTARPGSSGTTGCSASAHTPGASSLRRTGSRCRSSCFPPTGRTWSRSAPS